MNQELTPAIAWNILENLQEGVILAAPDGKILFTNQAAHQMLHLDTCPSHLATLTAVWGLEEGWQKLLAAPANVVIQTAVSPYHLTTRPLGSTAWQLCLSQPASIQTEAVATNQLAILTQISQESDFDKKLQLLVDGLQTTGWRRVVLTLRDGTFNATKIFAAGFTDEERQNIQKNMLPATQWRQLFENSAYQHLRRGSCYFVPAGSDWPLDMVNTILPDDQATGQDPDAWQPHDLLCVPLTNRQQQRIGLIGLDRPHNGRRPTVETLQTVELYAQFAGSIIENVQLLEETTRRSQEFELLSNVSNKLSGMLETNELLHAMGEQAQRAVAAERFMIFAWETTRQQFKLVARSASAQTAVYPAPHQLQLVLRQRRPIRQTLAATGEQTAVTQVLFPIFVAGEPYGVIELARPQTLSDREMGLLTALINQASANLETAVVFAEVYEREAFYNALGSVNLALSYTLDLDKLLNLICRESVQIFKVDGAYIWLREGTRFVGGAANGLGAETFIETAVDSNDIQAFVNVLAGAKFPTYINNVTQRGDIHLRLPHRQQIQAVLGIPLEREGNIIGVLTFVDHANPNRFSDKDVSEAAVFGVQAAIALQNATLFAELRRFNEELDLRVAERTRELHDESNRVKILLRITTELSTSLDQTRVLNRALLLVNEVVQATQAVILLIDPVDGELVFRATMGTTQPTPPEGIRSGLMYNEGLAGWMIQNREAVLVHNTDEDPRWVYRPTSSEHRSVLAVPLVTNDEVIGVMMFFHTNPHAFTLQQLDLLKAAAHQVANAINNANLYLLIREQAEGLGGMIQLEKIETSKNQAILQSIADGVLVGDARNRITLANDPVCRILGFEREQLLDKSINELLGLYSASGRSWLSTIDNWARNADRLGPELPFLSDQLEIENKSVSILLSPVLVGNQFFGTVSIFRDITHEVELDNLKSEFVSNVSHELRTPMTSIKGYADLMLMGATGPLEEAQMRYLEIIKNNAQRLQNLVGDLLNISHIETGQTKLDKRPLNLAKLVSEIVDNHLQGRIRHEQKPIAVYTDLPSDLPLVNADQYRVTQILTNLLDNAFNYTPAGGQIRVSLRGGEQFVNLAVQDSGIGITKENLAKIFDRFFRADDEDVQRVSGTGLGLAIVQGLVEMHGGTLAVESTPGLGSTFSFNLPIVVEESELA
ncbi:MAG: GAF domain-containing protein [Ardenticatenaceae bacterium]|nr:GAF domain-containing protein [Ardenticatenaceae bacterium]